MISAIGFTAIHNGTNQQKIGANEALRRALSYFPLLKQHTLHIGFTTLTLWGRGELKNCLHPLPDGSWFALIGSPIGKVTWQGVQDEFLQATQPGDFKLPWDGRTILLHVDAAGDKWRIWNDWLGSIPVYYAASSYGRIASTLEPAVVSANCYSANDFFLPGVVALLMHGHTLGDWTIFNGMKTLPPDSMAVLDENGCRAQSLYTIELSNGCPENGWNDMVDEMHQRSRNAILDVLATKSSWNIPLSCGLDSRLIAAVGSEAGVKNIRTYTWGAETTQEVIFSKRIAQSLGQPWKSIGLGSEYLHEHVRQWSDLFGSGMHFHGMYQFPFLNALKSEPEGGLISGYLGDTLAGYDVRFQSEYHKPNQRTYTMVPPNWAFFTANELRKFLKGPVDDALEQVADEIHSQRKAVPGPWYQSLRFMTLWGRQSHFTYFQSMLADYWFGGATPFMNRDYARFCYNLPRAALDDRRLQIDMMRRHYSKVMSIPGSYALEPAIMTGSYILKRRLANALPKSISHKLFPETIRSRNYKTDIAAIKKYGKATIWPIPQTEHLMADFINVDEYHNIYKSAAHHAEIRSLRKLQSFQALAYRFLHE